MVTPARGLIIELLTPLTDEHDLDRPGLARLVAFAAPHAQALLVAGFCVGQGHLLQDGLWRATVEAALEAAPPGLPLLVGLTAASSDQTLARARWLGGLEAGRPCWGLDAALFHHSNRGLPGYVEQAAQALGAPLILANCPDLVRTHARAAKRLNIMPGVLAKCARGPHLAGLVFSGPLRQGLANARALQAAPGAALYDGLEEAFLARPASAGLISAGAGLIPADWRLVVDRSLGLVSSPPGGWAAADRRALLDAGARVRDLAGLMANHPAPVAALLARHLGLITGVATLTPPPIASVQNAVLLWAQEVLRPA